MSAGGHCSPGCDRHHAAADLAHRLEQRLELVAVGEAARHRLAVDAAVRRSEAGGEAGGTGVHRLAQHPLHLGDLLGVAVRS